MVPQFTCLPLLNDSANYKTTFDTGCERCCMHAVLDSCVQDSFTAVCVTCTASHPSPCAVPVYTASLTSPQLSVVVFSFRVYVCDLQGQNGYELIGSTPLLRTFVCNNKPSMPLSSSPTPQLPPLPNLPALSLPFSALSVSMGRCHCLGLGAKAFVGGTRNAFPFSGFRSDQDQASPFSCCFEDTD